MGKGGLVAAAGVLLILACAGCSGKAPDTRSAVPGKPSVSQSAGLQSGEALQPSQIGGVPFVVRVPSGGAEGVKVLSAGSAVAAAEGRDFEVLGVTSQQGSLPGPTPRVVLDSGEAFGSRYLQTNATEVVGLEDIPSEVGLFATDGSFHPLAETLKELPGSNPEGLYFEPMDASAFGRWVVWREGSAGAVGAMPTLDSDDWRLIAWDRELGGPFEIASSFLTNGTRTPPYGTWNVGPSTDGRRVYYEATMPRGGTWETAIIAVSLDAPGKVDVVAWGSTPFADQSDGGVFWVDPDGTTVVRGGGSGEAKKDVFAVDSPGWTVTGLAGSSNLLVASVVQNQEEAPQAWMIVWDLQARKIVAIIDAGSDWTVPSVFDRTLVWGNGSGDGPSTMYRWDGSDVLSLGDAPGISRPEVGGETVALPGIDADGAVHWEFLRWK